ncbi:MAG: DUF2971 domain-containing protein [Candidatus Sedimenticola sp. (ex Thyasira tokunagai)]
MEGKLVAEIILHIAKMDEMDITALRRLQESIEGLETIIDGLGFCLSEERDLLSQWRGYAADATGVSIGFSKKYLEQLAEATRNPKKSGFTLQRVEYERLAQVNLVKPTYTKIRELIDKGAFNIPGKRGLLDIRSDEEVDKENEKIKRAYHNLSMTVLILFKDLFLLKTKAFSEELEWRLISYFAKTGDDQCMFRAANDRLIPYREFKLLELEESAISEIVVGPKNLTPSHVIEGFLIKHGFANVKVSHSDASYR